MLTPQEVEEYNKLWAYVESRPEDSPELWKAHDRMIALKQKARPGPTCCSEIQRLRIIKWQVYGYEEDRGHWRISCGPSDFDYRSGEPPDPKFCPFCATPLPELERFDVGAPVCNTRHESDYCHNCKTGSAMGCPCLPHSAAWRLKDG